jgi:hypothetical protein
MFALPPAQSTSNVLLTLFTLFTSKEIFEPFGILPEDVDCAVPVEVTDKTPAPLLSLILIKYVADPVGRLVTVQGFDEDQFAGIDGEGVNGVPFLVKVTTVYGGVPPVTFRVN